ncbi:hypothetical protein AAVH_37705, partial [Aphelenchoides avenae]
LSPRLLRTGRSAPSPLHSARRANRPPSRHDSDRHRIEGHSDRREPSQQIDRAAFTSQLVNAVRRELCEDIHVRPGDRRLASDRLVRRSGILGRRYCRADSILL